MKKLVGFITSSYPSNQWTIDLALSLKEAGVDILELGIPFSDPVADGNIIELTSLKSLENGFKLQDLFEVSKVIAKQIDTLWMGYMNIFYHNDMKKFMQIAKQLCISGAIIPDLPYEESIRYDDIFTNNNQVLINFVAPTHLPDRIKLITKNAKKFIYLVAYNGITGSSKKEDLTIIINNIRLHTTTPIYIGFGVDENNAKEKAKQVDGVIVGSAFMKVLFDDSLSYNEKIKIISQKARVIKDSINND